MNVARAVVSWPLPARRDSIISEDLYIWEQWEIEN